jgi:outer membrane protein OmpA-like peptidoglycan-associated protein
MHVSIGIAAALLMLAAGLASAQPAREERWSSYRDFWFDFDSVRIDATDAVKVADVAAYLKSNPTHRIGIDGEGTELDARRMAMVREALIKAGVPASKISTGAFGSAQLRRERRVEVLVDRRD